MEKLDIVLYPEEGLREVCRPVVEMNDRISNLIDEMFYTMYDALTAVCIQHEIDHLNGKLFIDHLSGLKRTRALQKFKKFMAEEARNK
jgi:peptide deformylase